METVFIAYITTLLIARLIYFVAGEIKDVRLVRASTSGISYLMTQWESILNAFDSHVLLATLSKYCDSQMFEQDLLGFDFSLGLRATIRKYATIVVRRLAHQIPINCS